MNQEIIDPDNIDHAYMLRLSNLLLEMERVINCLEHDRIDILGDGDPVLSDEELSRLNILGSKIWDLKIELAEKTAELREIKSSYYQEASRQLNYPIIAE